MTPDLAANTAISFATTDHRAGVRRRNRAARTLPTETVTFAFLVLGTVVIVGALSFFPGLILGPVIEALTRHKV